jgi:hypothetical protein
LLVTTDRDGELSKVVICVPGRKGRDEPQFRYIVALIGSQAFRVSLSQESKNTVGKM